MMRTQKITAVLVYRAWEDIIALTLTTVRISCSVLAVSFPREDKERERASVEFLISSLKYLPVYICNMQEG